MYFLYAELNVHASVMLCTSLVTVSLLHLKPVFLEAEERKKIGMLHEDLLLGALVGKCVTVHEELSGSLCLSGQFGFFTFQLFSLSLCESRRYLTLTHEETVYLVNL